MPRGLELVTGRVTAPGATTTALTANSGNSFAIRSALPNTPIWLLQAWGDFQAVGFVQIRSPRLHDNVRGIRLDMAVSDRLLGTRISISVNLIQGATSPRWICHRGF